MRKPWQVWVCTFAIAIMFTAIWADGVLQSIMGLIENTFSAMGHAPLGMYTLKSGLVLLVPAFMISLAIAWILSLISFVRGRPWGLLAAIGSLTVFAYVTVGAAIYVHLKGVANFHYEFIGCLLLVILGLGALLLSDSVKKYCSRPHQGAPFLISRGVLLGTAVSAAYLGAAYSLPLFGAWLTG